MKPANIDLANSTPNAGREDEPQYIKCVVWDLDNTLWDGVLLEDERVVVREHVVDIIKALDGRGILHSIASKNDHDTAMAKLRELGLEEYFIYPQISWNSKVVAVKQVAEAINIGLDAMAFVDDQPFELAEVKFAHPQLHCIDQAELPGLLSRPEMNPRFITADSRQRRLMYRSDAERKKKEEEFVGAHEDFLSTLDMRFAVAAAREDDLQRAEELTVRTNQLNSTGYTYSYDELNHFRQSPEHKLLIASLDDKYGSYGKIGLALLHEGARAWTIKLLLMSCRVMSRGVGTIMLNHIMERARADGVRLLSEFVSNEKNRIMLVSYKFAGFKEIDRDGPRLLLENDLTRIQPCPAYVQFESERWWDAAARK